VSDTPPATQHRAARWRRRALEAAIFVAALFAFQLWQLRDAERGPAPAFAGQRLDGSAFDLAAWRAAHPGRATLIYFWADWCGVCKTTAGNVSAVAADWPVATVAIQSGPPAAVAATMRERGYAWPVTLADPSAEILRRYGLRGVPAFVVIGPDGGIRSLSLGWTSEFGLRLRLWWASRGA